MENVKRTLVRVPAGEVRLEGALSVPRGVQGVVLFAHGSGSSRRSPRNKFVAEALQGGRLGTLLIDLPTEEEGELERRTRHLRFDIDMLARRLVGAVDWLAGHPETRGLSIGLFGASTGAGAALVAAAERPEAVSAVVSRGGRPDLAGASLERVRVPTLLIVGGLDRVVVDLNRQVFERLTKVKDLEVVPGASHLFEEPGMLDEVARLAQTWFTRYLEV